MINYLKLTHRLKDGICRFCENKIESIYDEFSTGIGYEAFICSHCHIEYMVPLNLHKIKDEYLMDRNNLTRKCLPICTYFKTKINETNYKLAVVDGQPKSWVYQCKPEYDHYNEFTIHHGVTLICDTSNIGEVNPGNVNYIVRAILMFS